MEASGQVRQAAAHLSKYRLQWPAENPPHRFLIVHKEYGQEELAQHIFELVTWLLEGCTLRKGRTCEVHLPEKFIEEFQNEHRGFDHWVSMGRVRSSFGLDAKNVDLIFTMGGDGTVLNAAWMFQQVVPPIMTFHFGTVGFLSQFDFRNFKQSISKVLSEGTRVNIRMRLQCHMIEGSGEEQPFECQVMNEVVVDRGPSPFMALLDLYGDGELLTSVLADGLILATTTGSTAYSMSAGGSVVHPDVPAIMITPICPHTLSLRPFIVPDSMELSLRLSGASRSTAWVSFDGRHRVELCHGDELRVACSKYPVTTVCRQNQTKDWFEGLSQCLRWNERPGKPVTP